MNLSYWERKTWLNNIDFAVIGSGIVGLSCALSLRKNFPKSKIVIFEKGMLPSGSSTKNAGIICFGSLSEILNDLDIHSEAEVVSFVTSRVEGLQLLRKTIGDFQLNYFELGGHELFAIDNKSVFDECLYKMTYVNQLFKDVFKKDMFSVKENSFGFQNIHKQLIFSPFEGQIDTGKMMLALISKASKEEILVLNNAEIDSLSENMDGVSLRLNDSEEISVKKLFIATNSFAKQFLKEDVAPTWTQVLVTKPIENLKVKGNFHLDKGYCFFRNIDDRILFGGGYNLDFSPEETGKKGSISSIQYKLDELLSTIILPNIPFEIDSRWSGIRSVGKQKKPILKRISQHVYCGIRLGGMDIAMGSSIGKQLANLCN